MAVFKLNELFIKVIVTFLGVGYLPLIPGTFGSVVGVIIFLSVSNNFFMQVLLTFSFFLLGFLLAGSAEKILKQKDHRFIVIDEVSGMLLSLLFIPYDFKLVIIAFLLFRILDTLKPYPAGKIQNLHGSAGVMGDDIIAALYTNIILQVVSRVLLRL
jgi:phosphatidylglycerophosphatase A